MYWRFCVFHVASGVPHGGVLVRYCSFCTPCSFFHNKELPNKLVMTIFRAVVPYKGVRVLEKLRILRSTGPEPKIFEDRLILPLWCTVQQCGAGLLPLWCTVQQCGASLLPLWCTVQQCDAGLLPLWCTVQQCGASTT